MSPFQRGTILALAAERDITRKTAAAAMEDHFQLTPDERAARIPSGSSTYAENRNGWAMTFLTKAKLIAKVAPRTYRITEFGRRYLAEHPTGITARDLETIPGWEEAWNTAKKKVEPPGSDTSGKTPIETLDAAIATINADVKSRLLATILEQSRSFFEQLVLDVLLAMGYGGSREDAAQHLGRSGDEGIERCINQDSLGLTRFSFRQAVRTMAATQSASPQM